MLETWYGIVLFVLLCIVGLVLITAFFFFLTSIIVFNITLVRTRKSKWSRACSSKKPDQVAMYNDGVKWAEANASYKKDLHIVNEGYNLYAEYYDFGYDRTVILIPGRQEGGPYGYFFLQAYPSHGYNVLTIDQRAHGLSDGKYNCLGFEEHKDLIAWCKLMRDEYGNKSIILHGICIGSSCAMMAMLSEDCPDCVDALIAEGMYTTFYESYKNHMIEFKKPVFVLPMIDMWLRACTGYSMTKGNIHIIDKFDKPLLMIHSKEDEYSLAKDAVVLYDMCPSKNKEFVWFEHGSHSKLRLVDSEKYDSAIIDFLERNVIKDTVNG